MAAKQLNPTTRALIQRDVGMSCEEIARTPIEEIHAKIERKIGRKLELKREANRNFRGSPLLDEDRIIWSDEYSTT